MLHVLTGPACNNNCLFCMEADRLGRDAAVRAQTPEHVRSMIASYPDDDEILFTSGEPTLNAELPCYIAWAKAKGFRVIGLITNGRRLAYPAFLASLLRAGLNRITISMHGHTAALHDGLTRTPGSFAQTHAALQNLQRAKKLHPIRVHTSTVLNRRNLPHVEQIVAYLAEGPADQIVFNVMMPKGRGALHFRQLMPRYAEVTQRLLELHGRLDDRIAARLRVVDMPPCIQQLLPASLRGELESFDQFEKLGSTGLTEVALLNPCSESSVQSRRSPHDGEGRAIDVQHLDVEWREAHRRRRNRPWLSSWERRIRSWRSTFESEEHLRTLISRPELAAAGSYYMTRRNLKDAWLRTRGRPCRRCAFAPSCPGVWKAYVEASGWSEFHPVLDPDGARRP